MLMNSLPVANVSGFQQAQAYIQFSNYQFSLTGSRRHPGPDSDKSDWDYFVIDCSNLRYDLTKIGFQELKGEGDYDINSPSDGAYPVKYIYRLETKDGQIDVQLCTEKGFNEKIIIHRIIDLNPELLTELNKFNKIIRKRWWTKMHEAVRGKNIGN